MVAGAGFEPTTHNDPIDPNITWRAQKRPAQRAGLIVCANARRLSRVAAPSHRAVSATGFGAGLAAGIATRPLALLLAVLLLAAALGAFALLAMVLGRGPLAFAVAVATVALVRVTLAVGRAVPLALGTLAFLLLLALALHASGAVLTAATAVGRVLVGQGHGRAVERLIAQHRDRLAGELFDGL